MQKRHKQALVAPLLVLSLAMSGAFMLTACGGGSDGPATTPPVTIAADKAYVSGTAAFGAPLVNATITLLDSLGKSITTTTAMDGTYSLDVTGLTAPFLVTASAQSGDEVKSFSALLITAPALGKESTINVTPLTTAIVALASSTGSSPEEFATTATLKNIDPAKLKKAEEAIKAIIADVVKDAGLPADFDPVKSVFKATLGTPADKILETVKVTVGEAGVILTNALVPVTTDAKTGQSVAATVTIKDVTTAISAVLPKPTVMATYNELLTTLQTQLNACLALDPADRVTLDTAKNPTALKGACSVSSLSAVASDYKNNGYDFLGRWGSRFRDLPKGAKVGQAEILAIFPQDSGGNTLSFRFPVKVESGGLTYGDTLRSGADGVWSFSGNQRKYDMGMSARMYKQVDASTYPRMGNSNGPDGGKNVGYLSRYESALSFTFNPTGPNAAATYAVKITGPGLPDAGLVLARSSVCGTGGGMAIYSGNGVVPDATGKTAAFVATNSSTPTWRYDAQPIGSGYKGKDFWNEVRGFDAPTKDSVTGLITAYNPSSAGPASVDGSPAAMPVTRISATSIPEIPKYKWEVYSVGSATPETFTMTLLDKPISPAAADAFPWATPSAESMKYLDPSVSNPFANVLDKAILSWTTQLGAPLVTWAGLSGNARGADNKSVRFSTGENISPVGGVSMEVAPSQETDGLGNACAKSQIPMHSATTGSRNVQFNQTGNRITMSQNIFHNGNTALAPVKPADGSIAWNVFNADIHPLQSGSTLVSDGKLAQFSLSTSTAINPAYINAASVSGGVLSLDTSVSAQSTPTYSQYGFSHAADSGYPKVGTLLARIGGNTTTTQRVMDLQAFLTDLTSGSYYTSFTIMNNTSAGAGGYIRVTATKAGTTTSAIYMSSTFDTSVPHIYQIVMTVTDGTGAGSVKVYLDGVGTPILDLAVAKFSQSTSTVSQIRFGQMNSTTTTGSGTTAVTTNLAYKSTMDWLLWAPGSYTPADLKGKLPAKIGDTTGY